MIFEIAARVIEILVKIVTLMRTSKNDFMFHPPVSPTLRFVHFLPKRQTDMEKARLIYICVHHDQLVHVKQLVPGVPEGFLQFHLEGSISSSVPTLKLVH